MVFKDVWRLLRSEKWTHAHAQGPDDGYYYVKPGCTVKAGKKGVDYFHGENALLDYVCADVDFCERHNIQLVPNESQPRLTQGSVSERLPTVIHPRQERLTPRPPKNKSNKGANAAAEREAETPLPRSAKTKKKKLLKKQLREQEDKRRRKMSSFRRFGLTYPKKVNLQLMPNPRLVAISTHPRTIKRFRRVLVEKMLVLKIRKCLLR
ncbi:uncharacterized protein IUM83_02847 [Phytophthora cinnamomi]|uniref:uncharacterized protein n=1 Tax=Phytophthora cinnamomi TaxID=4785 RepID=UPI00355AAC88|nr:hypothetical protein IUM83_02847 [Phytophthora cinnamomi]